jgi:F420-dependent oxidoreductase-like protein
MRLALMVEGQENVTWDQWLALASACERHDIDTLFRSDHYASVRAGQHTAALDSWAAICAVAARTTRLRLGTLVSPVTLRHPSVTAKLVVTADHVSAGRVELGLGAGWLASEHEAYGFGFPPVQERLAELREQIEIIHRQWTEANFSFAGERYTMADVRALPKPVQQPHPPLLLGGGGGRQSLALAARWADEYNTFGVRPEECRQRHQRLHAACEGIGRDPDTVRFSLMASCVTGRDRQEVLERVRRLQKLQRDHRSIETYLRDHADEAVIGTVEEVVDRLLAYREAGVERVVLDHLLHDDLDMVALVGEEIAPALREADTPR